MSAARLTLLFTSPLVPLIAQNRLLALNYSHPGEDPWVCDQHAAWGRDFQARVPQLPPRSPRASAAPGGRPLRVGYVSPDLFTHSVSYFAEALLAHHDAGAVAHHVYDCTPRRDPKSERLRAVAEAAGGVWRCAEGLSDEALAALVREDGIDILVELTGGWHPGQGGSAAQGGCTDKPCCRLLASSMALLWCPPAVHNSVTSLLAPLPQATPPTTGWA